LLFERIKRDELSTSVNGDDDDEEEADDDDDEEDEDRIKLKLSFKDSLMVDDGIY
jgi:hypothetical protein